MKIQKTKPTSPGIRHTIKLKKNLLSKSSCVWKLGVLKQTKKKGRSSYTGHITVRRKGGGTKKAFKNYKNNFDSNIYLILAIIYNSNQNSFLSLVFNPYTKKLYFTRTCIGHTVGTLLESGKFCNSNQNGSTLKLQNILAGSIISSISQKNKISVYIRSAGTFGQVIQKTEKVCKIKLPSGEIKNFLLKNYVTIGVISNSIFSSTILGKAGKSRKLGKRPKVRGVAMNPVDHPHGGRTNGGRPSVSPWGKLTKGVKTKKHV
jgi:large subunit ribosomal protein L2